MGAYEGRQSGEKEDTIGYGQRYPYDKIVGLSQFAVHRSCTGEHSARVLQKGVLDVAKRRLHKLQGPTL